MFRYLLALHVRCGPAGLDMTSVSGRQTEQPASRKPAHLPAPFVARLSTTRYTLELGRYHHCRYRYLPIFLTPKSISAISIFFTAALFELLIFREIETLAHRFCFRRLRPDSIVRMNVDVNADTLRLSNGQLCHLYITRYVVNDVKVSN